MTAKSKAVLGRLIFVAYSRLSCAAVRSANTKLDLLSAVFNVIGQFKHLIGYALTMPEASLFLRKFGVKNRF